MYTYTRLSIYYDARTHFAHAKSTYSRNITRSAYYTCAGCLSNIYRHKHCLGLLYIYMYTHNIVSMLTNKFMPTQNLLYMCLTLNTHIFVGNSKKQKSQLKFLVT